MGNQPMYIELTEQELNTIMIFLDRVDYKGLKEIQEINKVLSKLTRPVDIANIVKE